MKYEIILLLAKKLCLPSKDIDDIEEFLEHNEWGLAFEILCSVIDENMIRISTHEYNIIKKIAEDMKIYQDYIEILKNHVEQ